METILYIIIAILFKHFLADFLWQPKEMAIEKANSLRMLTLHAGVHATATTTLFLLINWLILPISAGLLLLIPAFDFISHWVIDFCSSRAKKREKLTPQDKKFWNLFGLDQFAHYLSYLIIITFII